MTTSSQVPTYTILEADGQYPDDVDEQQMFNANPTHPYKIRFTRAALAPLGVDTLKPWTDIPKELRDQVDGLMILKLFITEADLDLFPKLKVIVRMGVGYDRIDRVAAARRGIIVCNIPDYGTEEVADHALTLALTLRRGILLHHDLQRASPPAQWVHIIHPLVARNAGSTFGIFGLGRIGTAAALRAKAFGFKVLFYDPYLPNGSDKALGIERTKNVQDLFRRSNILSIHCPNTRETRSCIGYDLLRLLPAGSILVNTARGEIVDLDGVEQALKDGNLAGAGLDVLPQEPVPEPAHPLIQAYRRSEPWLTGRLVLTCHTAFFSPSSIQEIRIKSAQTMRDVLIDKLTTNVINPSTE